MACAIAPVVALGEGVAVKVEPSDSATQVALIWSLAKVEAALFGQSAADICSRVRNPERSGGHDMMELAAYLDHDLFSHPAWSPGGGRMSVPCNLQAHVDDILTRGVAGLPDPEDQ